MERKQADAYVEIMEPSIWDADGHMPERTKKALASLLASVPEGVVTDIRFENGSRRKRKDADGDRSPRYDYDAALKMVKSIGQDGLYAIEVAKCVETDIDNLLAKIGKRKLADDCRANFFRLCDSVDKAYRNFDETESDAEHEVCDIAYAMVDELICAGKVEPSDMDAAAILNLYY